jgi:hypothetical protein
LEVKAGKPEPPSFSILFLERSTLNPEPIFEGYPECRLHKEDFAGKAIPWLYSEVVDNCGASAYNI